ncbi:PAS domain-containing sensor histidine kinase [Halobaculum lipolyticum]|uniref:histidine kinase n=1 Tax=Halobaculum lipolyticum TaxID=3032001 RepID=A0ABD5W690_9EURY|nr:PAS domain-containing sensor histidine kinase [Halobaculum sp. DT31]
MSRPQLPPFADQLGTTILLHDPHDGRILAANEAAERLYGYPAGDLTGIDIERISSSSPRFTGEAALERIRAAADDGVERFEWQIRRGDGGLRWVDVSLRPYRLDGERYVLAEIVDSTESKTQERRVGLLNRLIRHNLRNDMTVIRGHAESLRRAIEDGDKERQAEVIADTAGDLGTMARTVAQIEDLAGNDSDDFRPTRLDSLVEAVAAEYRERHAGLTIETDTQDGIVVWADRGLRYGVEHAVDNAIEHAESAEPWVRLRTRTVADGRRAVVEIEDECPPIPDIEIDAVETGTDPTQLEHGTGVGLFAMQWCAESLGGKLDIGHRAPEGNVVRFTLPTTDEVPVRGE